MALKDDHTHVVCRISPDGRIVHIQWTLGAERAAAKVDWYTSTARATEPGTRYAFFPKGKAPTHTPDPLMVAPHVPTGKPQRNSYLFRRNPRARRPIPSNDERDE